VPNQVVNGAQLQCSFGAAPSTFQVLRTNQVQAENQYAANIMDFIPTTNIQPFGMCKSPTNPQVASATAAAMGTLTPQPCVPATSTPWTPGSPTVQIANQLALNSTSACKCMWLGVITVTSPGETSKQIP
jgi:hypothetical protein